MTSTAAALAPAQLALIIDVRPRRTYSSLWLTMLITLPSGRARRTFEPPLRG